MASSYITITDIEDSSKWYVVEVYDSWTLSHGHGRIRAATRGGNSSVPQHLIDGLANV